MNHHRFLLISTFCVGAVLPAPAATLIDFTGDGSNGSSAPSLPFGAYADDGSGNNVRTAAYASDLNAAPSQADGLPVLAGSAYQASLGGAATNVEPTTSFTLATGGTQPQPERLRIRGERGTGFINRQRIFLEVQKNDFLDLASQPVFFDPASTISLEILSGSNGQPVSLNFVVNDGGSYYISESFINSPSSLTITNPDSANWASFNIDPATNFGGIDPTSISGTPHTFSDVQGIGFFIQSDWPSGGSNQGDVWVRNWTATATTIPEPSALHLIVLAIALVSLRRHRR